MSFDFLENKTILITGGTGSFGQKMAHYLLKNTGAGKVVIFSRDELKQSQMQADLADFEDRTRFFIGDVRDLERLQLAFNGMDYILHAAALKQVPALEYNPIEAIRTNVLGTQNVISAALNKKVKKVLLISTDKAANPANLYGATKLCAEKLTISSNVYSGDSGTSLSVVRYGNVLGSRGSLLQVIEKQKQNGEVALTHEKMTRFWVTLDQGVKFVLESLEQMVGGEIFIPKIPSMKIKDFIAQVAPNCKIKIIGMRPGEKIHETLVTPEECKHTMEFEDRYVIFPEYNWWTEETTKNNYKDGKQLAEGTLIASHTNSQWLDEEGLKKLINSL